MGITHTTMVRNSSVIYISKIYRSLLSDIQSDETGAVVSDQSNQSDKEITS